MEILIIEDEIPAAKRLEKLILECKPQAQILEVIDTVEDALEWFKINSEPDLIISDIQLADGVSFQIYEELDLECPIIFSTAYDQYAVKAFELNSIDYLLKPYSKNALQKSFDKLEKFSPSQNNSLKKLDLNTLLNQVSSENVYKQRFLISKADALIPISTDDICLLYTSPSPRD